MSANPESKIGSSGIKSEFKKLGKPLMSSGTNSIFISKGASNKLNSSVKFVFKDGKLYILEKNDTGFDDVSDICSPGNLKQVFKADGDDNIEQISGDEESENE